MSTAARKYFEHLNYTLGDEDAALDMAVCPMRPREVVTVAGSGTRIAPLLSRFPQRLTVVDISPVQLAVAQLRYATLCALDLNAFNSFWGYPGGAVISGSERQAIFDDLPGDTGGLRRIVRTIFEEARWGPILYRGRFERMLGQLAKVNRVVTGRAGREIFECSDLSTQRTYWSGVFPRRRWSAILFALGNAPALNALLYRGGFPRKNRPERSYDIYKAIFDRLFHSRLARESFLLQLLFFGRLRYPEGLPPECETDIFDSAKRAARSAEVAFVHQDVFDTVAEAARPFDFVGLSDVPSFLGRPDDVGMLQRLRPHLPVGGVVLARGHLRLVVPDATGFDEATATYEQAALAERTQLWTVQVWKKS